MVIFNSYVKLPEGNLFYFQAHNFSFRSRCHVGNRPGSLDLHLAKCSLHEIQAAWKPAIHDKCLLQDKVQMDVYMDRLISYYTIYMLSQGEVAGESS